MNEKLTPQNSDGGGEDLHDQEKQSLLDKADTIDKVKKEIKTEVTSIRQEEKKTGQTIKMPSPEEMIAKASASFMANRRHLSQLFPKLSSKAKNRTIMAILDLPQEDLHVPLKKDDERLAFAIGQRMLADRFLMTQYYMMEQRKKDIEESKQKLADEAKENKEKDNESKQQKK